jgi:hypothetical protein
MATSTPLPAAALALSSSSVQRHMTTNNLLLNKRGTSSVVKRAVKAVKLVSVPRPQLRMLNLGLLPKKKKGNASTARTRSSSAASETGAETGGAVFDDRFDDIDLAFQPETNFHGQLPIQMDKAGELARLLADQGYLSKRKRSQERKPKAKTTTLSNSYIATASWFVRGAQTVGRQGAFAKTHTNK